MISLESIHDGGEDKPPIILNYGVAGIGKTSLGASAPAPIFLQTEDGFGLLKPKTFGLLRSYDDLMQAVGVLYNDAHNFQTVVIDTLDHTEPLLIEQSLKDNGWSAAEGQKYKRVYAAALDLWRVFFDGLKALRDDRGMTVFMLAHCDVEKFESPDNETYSRYSPKLNKHSSELAMEISDCVLFSNYRISTVKTDAGFNRKVVRGVGGGERVLYTTERPAHLAKNRFNMPDQIPMEWSAIASAIPALANQTTA